jgi:hypothetical protein
MCSQISVTARFDLAEVLLPVAAQADESFCLSQQAAIKILKPITNVTAVKFKFIVPALSKNPTFSEYHIYFGPSHNPI